MTSEKSRAGWYFLITVVLLYLLVFTFSPETGSNAVLFTGSIFVQLIPMILLIIGLTALMNYYVKPKTLVNHMGKGSGIKGWIIATASGIISTGPIYMWYPLLSELKNHGVRNALIASFLYNRAVKIPLLPLLVFYFGVKYAMVLTIVTVSLSIIAGWLTEKIIEVIK